MQSETHTLDQAHLTFHLSNIIITQEQKLNLTHFFQKPIISTKLLYKASQNHFQTKVFHKLCDQTPNTLTILETVHSKKIGAFTTIKWSSPSVPEGEWIPSAPSQSFVFSLSNNHKFTLKDSEFSIFHDKELGPTFGSGFDLGIFDQADSKHHSYARIGKSYQNENYTFDDKSSWESFSGAKETSSFLVKEWEVWQLQFDS